MSETPASDERGADHQSDTADPETDDPPEAEAEEDERTYLSEVEDGCGCAEVWEHLSERRRNDD